MAESAQLPESDTIFIHNQQIIPIPAQSIKSDVEIPLPPGVREPEIINTPNGMNSPITTLPMHTFEEMTKPGNG